MIVIRTDPLEETPARSVIYTLPIISKSSDFSFFPFKSLKKYGKIVSEYAKYTRKTKSFDKRVLKLNNNIHLTPLPGRTQRYSITKDRLNTLNKKSREQWEDKDNLMIVWVNGDRKLDISTATNDIQQSLRAVATSSYATVPLPLKTTDTLLETIKLLIKVPFTIYLHVLPSEEKKANSILRKLSPKSRRVWRAPRIKVKDTKPSRKKYKSERVR